MKKLFFLLGMIFINIHALAFANPTNVNALTSAWKAQSTVNLPKTQHDINIVYGGEDISKNTILSHGIVS